MKLKRMRSNLKHTYNRLAALLLAMVLCVSCLPLQAQAAKYPLLNTSGHAPYMVGTGDDKFSPDATMTRAQAAQILYNLLTSKTTAGASRFSDVSISSWYGQAVNVLADLGVVSGKGYGRFDPSGQVTRAQFVTMVCLCFDISGGRASFSDTEGHWAADYISAAADSGWISGVGDGKFAPDRSIKRSEATSIINGALGRKTRAGYAADAASVQKFSDVPPTHSFFKDITEAASPAAVTLAVGDQVRVIARNGLNFRATASSTGTVIKTLALNSYLTVMDLPGSGWVGVMDADGNYGYVSAEYVVFHRKLPTGSGNQGNSSGGTSKFQVGDTARVIASSGLNLRAAPVNGAVLRALPYGTIVTIKDISNPDWPKVTPSGGGNNGYVSAEYLEYYSTGSGGVLSVTASSVTMRQYQTLRLDASASGGINHVKWSSSNANVAVVGYTVPYNNTEHGAMIYARSPGKTTLTFSDSGGNKQTVQVTVTSAEPIRYAYADENAAVAGRQLNLVAVTDTSRSSVTFQVSGGVSYTSTNYTTQSRTSAHGLGTNTVRVFQCPMTFSSAGTYTVKATASGSAEAKEFTVFVQPSETGNTVTSNAERRTSTQMLNIIANFEGSVPEIEDDMLSRKNPTVGYGYVVANKTAFYNNLTPSELYAMLVDTINNHGYSSAVNSFRSRNNLKMSQSQFDALVSWVYNCGTGVLSTNTYDTPRVMLNAVVPPANASESSPVAGTLNVADAALYRTQSLASTGRIINVPEGSKISVIGTLVNGQTHEVWYQATYSGKTGWIPAGYVSLTGSYQKDLAYGDVTVLANNFLQWHTASGVHYEGLIWRRMAEAKIFFHANYAEAYHSHANYRKNTYGFLYPSCCSRFDIR